MKITVSFRRCRGKAVPKLEMKRGLQLTKKVQDTRQSSARRAGILYYWLAFSDNIKHSKDYSPKMDSQLKTKQKITQQQKKNKQPGVDNLRFWPQSDTFVLCFPRITVCTATLRFLLFS